MANQSSGTPKHLRDGGAPRTGGSRPAEPYRPKHFARTVAVGITAASLSLGLAACAGESAAPGVTGPTEQDVTSQLVSRISVSYGSPEGDTEGPVYDFTRDEAGNITKVTISGWAGGSSSTYECSYDDGVLSGYELSVEGGDPDSVTYERDADGRVTLERHASYSVSYEYDPEGRLVSKTSDNRYSPYARSYEYDSEGRLVSTSISSDALSSYRTSYSYDEAGHLTSARESSVGSDGQEMAGVSSLFGYDSAGRLISRLYEGEGSSGMIPATYGRDADGRVVSATALSQDGGSYQATYEYGEGDKLVSVSVSFFRADSTEPAGTTTYDIEYQSVAGELEDAVSVGPNFGALRVADSVRLVEVTSTVPGISDPLPFQPDSPNLI